MIDRLRCAPIVFDTSASWQSIYDSRKRSGISRRFPARVFRPLFFLTRKRSILCSSGTLKFLTRNTIKKFVNPKLYKTPVELRESSQEQISSKAASRHSGDAFFPIRIKGTRLDQGQVSRSTHTTPHKGNAFLHSGNDATAIKDRLGRARVSASLGCAEIDMKIQRKTREKGKHGRMRTVILGKTGLKVSRIGIGGIPITRPSEAEAIKVVQRALDLGINFIDTAIGYSDSEKRIGKAIAGRREQVIVATKGWGDKATVLKCIEASLRHLKTDYIDLWQFHNINTIEYYQQIVGTGGGMEGARYALQTGKIRHIGFSSHTLKVALKVVASGHFETVQFPLNFISNEAVAADELVPLAQKNDVGFIAMKPFAGGRIRDANLAIKYLLQFENVVPDPGIEKAAEIEQIVSIVNSGSWKLTSGEQQEIEAIRARVGTRFCRQCGLCMPCPQGVHICGVMYLPILWELWPSGWFLSWPYVTNAVKSAENCIECGECEEKCPYQLPIREMIVENIQFFESVRS